MFIYAVAVDDDYSVIYSASATLWFHVHAISILCIKTLSPYSIHFGGVGHLILLSDVEL